MATSQAPYGTTAARRPWLEFASLMVGVVFLLVGVAGFIPGITQNFDALEFAGHDSEAMLLGIFQVSVLHNVVHLLFGVAGIAAARTAAASRAYLIGGGAIYGLLWIYGMVIDKTSEANFVPVNRADDWLHFALAAGMIVLGVVLGASSTRTAKTGV